MTIPEFLVKLRATKGPWAILADTKITDSNNFCPIQAVAVAESPLITGYRPVFAAAKELGISREDTVSIMRAADFDWRVDSPLRHQLLAATVERAK